MNLKSKIYSISVIIVLLTIFVVIFIMNNDENIDEYEKKDFETQYANHIKDK